MTTTIDTVFEKGVFRPLQPVAIPENRRVLIEFEEAGLAEQPAAAYPRSRPQPYPDDYPVASDAEYEYVPVPAKATRTVRATCQFVGKRGPLPYPDE